MADRVPGALLSEHTTLRLGGPAAELVRATTEEQLVDAEELALVATLRRRLHDLDDRAAGELLQDGLRSSQTNLELLRQVQRSAAGPAAGSAQRG